MRKTNKNQTTTNAIMVTSEYAINFLKNQVIGKMYLGSIERLIDSNDVTILGDNVVLFKNYELAQEVAYEIQHEGLVYGGYATVFKVSESVVFDQMDNLQIKKSLFGQ